MDSTEFALYTISRSQRDMRRIPREHVHRCFHSYLKNGSSEHNYNIHCCLQDQMSL